MGLDQYFEVKAPGVSENQQVGYWRKANAIHEWMRSNLAPEVSPHDFNCYKVRVPVDKMTELREACQKVLDNPDLAPELLPPVNGFFFGGTEMDEWYLRDLEETIKIMDKAIEIETHSPDHEHYYDSWW